MAKALDTTKPRRQGRSNREVPRFIRIRLNEIEFDTTSRYCVLQSRLKHLPQAVPALTPAALTILELAQPMLVVLNSEPNRSDCYRLVAGFRTFQLLAEQKSRDTKTWALLIPRCDQRETNAYSAFDSTVAKVLQRPDGNDLAVMASTLHGDRQFREEVGKFIPISTDNNLAAMLGMSRSTLNRQIGEVEKAEKEYAEQRAPTHKIDLDFPAEEDDPL
jgi:hypothetical protein